jgi:hypothetical protein
LLFGFIRIAIFAVASSTSASTGGLRPAAGRPIGLSWLTTRSKLPRDGSSSPTSLAVALVLQFAAHVVVGLIEKSDETVDLSARLEAEPADSNKDILRCGILADVQPIKAGYWGKVQTC